MTTEMEKIFSKSKGLTDVPFSFCPGCTHGTIMRLIAEVLEELDIIDNTIGISPVGCAGFSQDFFSCDFIGAAHGRAQAVGIGVKGLYPTVWSSLTKGMAISLLLVPSTRSTLLPEVKTSPLSW